MKRRNSRKKEKKSINKKTKVIIISSTVLLLFLLLFSVIFSVINMGNSKIIKGVKYLEVDLSNLSSQEATEKINKWKEELLQKNIKYKYEELEKNVKVEDYNLNINVDEIVQKSIQVGKTGNVIKDNYTILWSLLFGKKIDNKIEISEEVLNKNIEEINKNLPNALIQSGYYIEDNNLIIKKGKSGVVIDKEKFSKNINECINKGIEECNIPVIDEEPKQINIEEVYNDVYKEKQDAYITKNPLEIHPEVNGIDFAISIEEAKQKLEDEKEEYIIPLKISKPDVTLEKLGKEAFPSKLGSFTTRYDASNVNRSTNLELASKKIDGTIVLPGKTFSYNKVVGQRTIALGYKEAAVYSNGKVVEGIGGGICQLSSTLYNAVLYANLEIASRSNHQFLTSYVTAGRDATVSWGGPDFAFKNNRKYPVKIVSTVKNGVATVEIYGMKEEKEYEVVIETTTEEVIPYKTKYVTDYNIEEGEEEIVQNGMNGVKSKTYKTLKYNGIVISKTQISEDKYNALERIIKRGKTAQQVNSNEENSSGFSVDKEELKELNPSLLNNIRELE